MLLIKDFKFDAAHFLPKYHGKCEQLHGHTYQLRVTISGELGAEGMVCDFVEVKKVVLSKVIDILDHSSLNDTIPNPSAENIAIWVWHQLADDFNLYEIQIWETEDSSVILRREDMEYSH